MHKQRPNIFRLTNKKFANKVSVITLQCTNDKHRFIDSTFRLSEEPYFKIRFVIQTGKTGVIYIWQTWPCFHNVSAAGEEEEFLLWK